MALGTEIVVHYDNLVGTTSLGEAGKAEPGMCLGARRVLFARDLAEGVHVELKTEQLGIRDRISVFALAPTDRYAEVVSVLRRQLGELEENPVYSNWIG